jgi:hypothetical protein
MPAPRELTLGQIGHIQELVKDLGTHNVEVLGYDLPNYLVIGRTDAKGYKRYSIRPDGSGRNVIEPVLQFTDDDLAEFPYRYEKVIAPLIR